MTKSAMTAAAVSAMILVATSSIAQGNEFCASQCMRQYCYREPAYIANGVRGDMIVHKGEQSPVAAILAIVLGGNQFSHAGILTNDGWSFRHNSAARLDPNNFDGLVNERLTVGDGWFFGWGSVDYGDVRIDPYILATPGGVSSASTDSYWNRSQTHLIEAHDDLRWFADYSVGISEEGSLPYGLYGFVNHYGALWSTTCSGLMVEISRARDYWGHQLYPSWKWIDSGALAQAGAFLYDLIRKATYKSSRSGSLDSQGRSNIARTIRDQVMNCFRFGPYDGACNQLGSNWINYGSLWAYSASPNDMLQGGNDAWKDYSKPAQFEGGGYWCGEYMDGYCYDQCAGNGESGGPSEAYAY